MENALKQAFNTLIETRVEEAAFLNFKQTHQYAETAKQIDEGFEKLKASFTTENQTKMLLELENAWNRQQALYLEYTYRQGVEDSAVLQDMLKKLEWRIAKVK